ncbi:Sulfite efflux pump SSU1 [Smittium mucronatum]|uniref:Sulfite efflux pump SSU1 n=1 Tax=Smittium mucronatum TaxID=133383 RepID=A0A1R0GL09_9FUNG|nr:Sulfite efflux pump SSU1 [Smittium mucronatum]
MKRKSFPDIIKNFAPSWFSVTMGTGITGILIYTTPYQFHGCHTLGKIFFALNCILFISFFVISVIRYTVFPYTINLLLCHPGQSMFIGTMPMGLATIVNSVVFMFPKEQYHWAPNLAFVLYFIDVAFMLFSVLVVPFFKLAIQKHSMETMYTTWLLPIVPAVVTAATGSVVASVLEYERAKLVLILSYLIWGLGFPLSMCIIAFYYSKTVIYKLPPPELLISVFLPLGPLGQGSFGILNMGITSTKLFNATGKEFVPVDMISKVAEAGGTLMGLVIWGFGIFWLSMAVACVIYGLAHNEVKFNIGWWGLTFPLGVFISSTNTLATLLQNRGFKIFGAVLTISLTILWFYCMFFTLRGIYTTKMFVAPCLTPQSFPTDNNVDQEPQPEPKPGTDEMEVLERELESAE